MSPEVVVAEDDVIAVRASDVAELKRRASTTPLRRSRVCAHGDSSDPLHEMVIALDRDTYVRPHKHRGKTESFHVIEGSADVVVFDDDGRVREVVELGEYATGRAFYYRLNVAAFHTVLVRSQELVIHETTNGPFRPDDAVFADWAPAADDTGARAAYLTELDERVREHLTSAR